MSWICCPCRCRRRIKTKAVHTISATIRCNGDVAPSKQADFNDGRYVEPVSDLAQQAYKHLDFVEEERRRGSRVFDPDWAETERDEVDHADHIHLKSCPEAGSSHHSHSSTPPDSDQQTKNEHVEQNSRNEEEKQQKVPKDEEIERNVEKEEKREIAPKEERKKPASRVETTTSTERSTTQEIETQVEAKQFHEQSCQSDDLPPPQIIEIIREPEPKIEEVDPTEQLQQQFVDLHKSLLNWLEETEEMVENQKPPSADYKVVKAQLQNHDFQTKLVDDKQENFDKLTTLAHSLQASKSLADPDKQNVIDKAIVANNRFNALIANVHQRRQDLLDAQELANDFHRTQQPLSVWLEDASQRVSALCKVVTTKEEIEANIEKQEALKREIDSKRDTFDSLADCYSQLVRLVGADDANELDAQVRNLSARYDELGRRCVQCGHALHGFSEDMSSFLADTDELAEWLDQIEREFERLGELPLDGQELVALSEEFAELANAISERSASVTRIVDESREICTHTSGSEALAMSARIDRLHSRYNQLLNASMERIEVFATAIRVSDELVDLVEQLEDFMDACDDALGTLDDSAIEEQLECVEGLSEELEKNAPLIEDVEEMTHQLRTLSNKAPNEQQDVELIRRSDQLRHRFSATRVLVEERKRRLQMADSRGRQTFDALDFWLEFFEDALEQSARADRPPADLEQLKELMHKQRTLNERVASERAGVRDLVAEAARVARDINSNLGGEDPQMDAKIERVRKLVEETAEAGADRLAVLEQVYELCKELVPAYEELNDGMSKLEAEFQKCRPIQTGQPLEELREQLEHNQQMLQLARTEKQNLAKFEQNIDAVVELCAKEDGEHLRKLCEQIRERHADIQNAFAGRGDALEQTIGDNTKFADRFAAFVKSLEAAAVHARHLDPIAARPQILRRQLSENAESIRLWEQKSAAFESMRSQAMDQLAQVKHNEAQVLDLSQKLATLDELWLEVRSAYDARDRQLRTTLPLAEQFWNGSAATQAMFKNLGAQLHSLPETGIEPATMGVLERVKNELATATPQFEALQRGAAELLLNVGDESERSLVEQQLQLLDHEWQMLSQSFNQRSTQLGTTHDKANQYGHACQMLQQWLQQADEQLQQLDHANVSEAPAIRQVIDQLQNLRSALNVKALERDDLNRLAHELCLNAQPAQVAAIRAPLHAVGDHLNRLYALVGEKQHRLERSLIDLGQVEQAHAQLQAWLAATDLALQSIQQTAHAIGDSDAKRLDLELAKLATIRRDISAHVPSFDALEKVASAKSAPLLADWMHLQRKANQLHAQLEDQLAAATSKTSQLDKWQVWLSDVLSQLSTSKLVGALPETVATQLGDLRLLVDEVEQKRVPLAHDIDQAQKQMDAVENPEEKQWIQDRLNPVRAQWQQVQERLASREAQLKKAELEALDLAQQIQSMSDWVEQAEHALNIAAPISRLPAEIQRQIDEHSSFVEMSQAQRSTMAALSSRGLKVQMTCEKKDAIPIKNQLVSLKNRNERIAQRALERQKQMEAAKKEADAFEHAEQDISQFINSTNDQLNAATQEPTTGEKIRDELERHKQLEADLNDKKPAFEEFVAHGRLLVDAAPAGEKKELSGRCEKLKTKWIQLESEASKRKRLLDEALVQSGKFDEALAQMLNWLSQHLPPLEDELTAGKMAGDTDTLQALIKENDRLADEMKTKLKGVTTIRRRAEEVLAGGGEQEDKAEIQTKMDRMNDEWQRLEKTVDRKSHLLNEALDDGVELTETAHQLHERLNDLELRLRSDLNTSTDQTEAAAKLVQAADKFADEALQLNSAVQKWSNLAKSLRERAHPRAQAPISELQSAVNARWQQVEAILAEKSAAIRDLHSELLAHDKLINNLEGFVATEREVLAERNGKCAETWTLPEIQDLIVEHSDFKERIRSRQPEMDSIMKLVKRSGVGLTANLDEDTKGSQANLSKSMTSISGTLPRQKSIGGKSRLLPEKQTTTKRQRKANQLNETWNQLWTDTIETEDKLKERKADIEELRRLENFTFAEWRERYLAWNDSAKARISDLFRRIDKHGAGFVPRQQFIDGVLSSKFPTTRLEMEKVADEFDKNGQISSKEFMNALRYEGRNRRLLQGQQQAQPKSDPERIHNEIKKETQRCQCAHPFKINRDNSTSSTGTVRYAFGESSIKRMVRILHSTVMVRVGGGWVELSGFLLKHDPCRAKGRTNLELYQGHEFMPSLTPEGAVDQMGTFQRKHSSSLSAKELRLKQNAQLLEAYKQGPIIKIREKTDRSIPMFKKPGSVASSRSGSATRQYSRQSSDVSIKVDGSRIPRPTSSNNLVASRPSSRASDVSDLSAATPSRIPSIRGRKNGDRVLQASSARQSPMPR